MLPFGVLLHPAQITAELHIAEVNKRAIINVGCKRTCTMR